MVQRASTDPAHLHRREVFARLANKLVGDNLGTDLLDPMSIEDKLFKAVNLGQIVLTDLFEHNFSSPTLAMQAGAGTTPPAAVLGANSTDGRGSFTFGTGTTPAAGDYVKITFGTALPTGRNAFVSLDPANSATALLVPYISSATNTFFIVGFANAGTASQANTTYAFHYTVS